MKGGKTVKCPDGQTRDKKTKECRDKKPRGRKPGSQTRRASVASVKSEPKVEPKVEPIRHKSFQITVMYMNSGNSSSYVKWYRSELNDIAKLDNLTNMKVEYNKSKNVLDVSYDTTRADLDNKHEEELLHEMLADPDDDCNHPLFKKCVSGRVVQ